MGDDLSKDYTMREIKFRVWDGKRFLYSYADSGEKFDYEGRFVGVDWFIQCQRLESPQRFWVQQYTGLTDRNGQEIYEGDILKSGFSTTVVEWDDDIDQDFYWGNACGFRFNFDPETMNPNGGYEVIGNIFEGIKDGVV